MENKELKDRIKFKIAMSEIDNEEIAKMKNKKVNILSKIAAVVTMGILISGATFADEISEKVYDFYNFRKQYVIETKLPEEVVKDEEKLEEVLSNKNSIIKWDERAADSIECNDVDVNITEVMMDDYYMTFYANINFPTEVTEKMSLENIYLVRFPDLVIKDESDNVIFCMEENKLKEIFETDDLDKIRNNPKYCISEVTDYGFENYHELGKNPYKMHYHLNTRQPSIYPKSNKLVFEFTKIALDPKEAAIGIYDKHYLHQDQALTVLGDWKIEIDVPRKYYEREDVIAYKVIESDEDPKNEVLYCYYEGDLMYADFRLSSEQRRSGPWESVKLGDMLVEYEVDPIIRQYIIHKVTSSDEYKEMEAWQDEVYTIEDYYIENDRGEKSKERGLYKRVGDEMVLFSRTGGFGGVVHNGILISSVIPGTDSKGEWGTPKIGKLDIEKEKLTDKMTIYIKYLGKDIEFKLERMKGDE